MMKQAFIFSQTYLVPMQLVLAMLGMGATLSVRDFVDVFKNPSGLALGLALQLVLVPMIAAGFVWALDMEPGWAVGLVLIAAVPGGTVSNLFTHLARGNTPLSISVTLASTTLAMVSIPFMLNFFAAQFLPGGITVPTGKLVQDLIFYLLLPLILGMVVYRWNADKAVVFSKRMIQGSLGLVVIIAIAALGSGRMKIGEYGWGPPLTILAFCMTLALVTPHICRLVGRFDHDVAALNIEVTFRNTAIGLLLVQFFFPDQPEQGHVLYTCLFYAGIALFVALPTILLHRAGKSPVLGRKAKPPVKGSPGIHAEGVTAPEGAS